MTLPSVLPAAGGVPDLHVLATHGSTFVVGKPPGLPTTGRDLRDPNCLQYHVMARIGRKVWVLHQLDTDTSGLVVMTLDRREVPKLQAVMTGSQGRKTYLAFCRGTPPRAAFTVDAPLLLSGQGTDRLQRAHPDGKPARTDFVTLVTREQISILGARLRTGRTHQIRAHLATHDLHLLGERRYTDPPDETHDRQALHAWHIALDTEPPLTATAPLPDDLRQLCHALGVSADEIETAAAGLPWL